MSKTSIDDRLSDLLRELRLPAVRTGYREAAERAAAESLGYEHFLLELVEREAEERRRNRIERLLRQSRLPAGKTLDAFALKRLPRATATQVRTLVDGGFVDRCENILAFGNPGSGKTHLLCAIGHELVAAGRSVYFAATALLVEQLLAARRDLRLDRLIKKLGRFDAIILDDLGYVQHSRDEAVRPMEVLFTLLAQRYERGSVLITSNLPFSKWEQIFKDPMTTAAAIDRLVHHSVILELNVSSYRMEAAKKGKRRTTAGG
jgi:DNA replication protein DnaC